MSRLDVVVGAAYGSEGKGHITAQIVKRRLESGLDVLNIRVAGPNAGHTVLDKSGEAYPLRQIPVGMAIHDKVYGYISPGSEVELEVLISEVELLRAGGHKVSNLYVSGEATLLEGRHKQTEADVLLTERTGSTGKGIGAARVDRLMRTAERVKDRKDVVQILADLGVTVVHEGEPSLAFDWLEQPQAAVVIEGTQGYGLGLHAGHYPQTTSSDCRAIDFLSMAGISPWQRTITSLDIWLVARVFPIRVAGNSGPMKGETSWEELGLPEEHTTVTHKVRRVGEWDGDLVAQAVRANGGTRYDPHVQVKIALTMVDQKFPDLKGVTNLSGWVRTGDQEQVEGLTQFIQMVEGQSKALVGVVATGPDTVSWRN